MGVLNSRNLRKAKELLDKNRHKAGDIVGKAGQQLDKVSKGKTSNLTSKATEAAEKFAEGAATRHDFGEASGAHDGMPADRHVSSADANAAGVAAANAMTNTANAATNFLNSAAAQAQAAAAQQPADGAEATGAESDDPAAPSNG